MLRSNRNLVIWLLCLQVLFGSIAGTGISTQDDLHVATAHQAAVDHHHHNDFSSHFDHDDGPGTHVHAVDSFQSVGLIQDDAARLRLVGSQGKPVVLSSRPPDIFLEGLLRPPQILL